MENNITSIRSTDNHIDMYQWEQGQYISISGLGVSTAPHVSFSSVATSKAITISSEIIEDNVLVAVPNSMLKERHNVLVHVVEVTSTTSTVIDAFKINVLSRVEPADYVDQADINISDFSDYIAEVVAEMYEDNLEAFNDNATAKTTAFDANATAQTTAFDANVVAQTSAFDVVVADGVQQVVDEKDELANARKSFLLDEWQDTLNERLDTDFNNILQRILGSTTIPYTGEYITANETYLGLTDSMEVRGKTYQNLARLDLDSSELFTLLPSIASLSNGQISIGNTTSNTTIFYKYNVSMYKPSTQYTLVLDVYSNDKTTGMYINGSSVRSVFATIISTLSSIGAGRYKYLLTTRDDISECDLALYMYSISTGGLVEASGSITYSFQIFEGDLTSDDYIPSTVTGIESVVSPTVKTVGKNLVRLDLDGSELISSGVSNYTLADGIISMDSTKTVNYIYNLAMYKPSTQYTMVVELLENTGTFYLNTTYGKQSVFSSQATTTSTGVIKQLFTTYDDISVCQSVTRLYSGVDTTVKYRFMILEGDYTSENITADNWDDYAYQSDEITYDVELRRVGDVYDYVDVENNRVVRNIEKFILTESLLETLTISTDLLNENTRFYISLLDVITKTNMMYCNIYPVNATVLGSNSKDKIISVYTNGNIYIRDDDFSTTTDFKNYLISLAQSGNPMEVYLVLETPTYEDITARQLKTFEGTTHIFSENSNVEPENYARIPSDVGASVASANETIAEQASTISSLEDENQALTEELLDTQEALVDLYESEDI